MKNDGFSIKRLDRFNCIVAFIGGELKRCSLNGDGSIEMWAGCFCWKPVHAPVQQEFIDAVNVAFDRKLTQADFVEPTLELRNEVSDVRSA